MFLKQNRRAPPIICEIAKRFFAAVKRKYPVDPEQAKQLPIFEYGASKPSYNRLFVWGSSQTGALGVPYYRKRTSNYKATFRAPKRLGFAEKHEVTQAACGYGFTIYAINTKDEVKAFGTGLNSDGQIGKHELREGHPLETVFFPQPIHLPFKDAQSAKVIKVVAGRAHALILTTEGLFLLGNNSYGQCARRVVSDEDYFKSGYINRVPKIEGKEIKDVACGQDNSLGVTVDGEVYACGCGSDGQNGLGSYEIAPRFAKIGGDLTGEKIVKVTGRGDFMLALNDHGDVFGWGNNEYSQLNMLGELPQQQCTPIHLAPLKKFGKIIDIAAGGTFCLALNENGDVLTWGFGLLGLGPKVDSLHAPRQIPPALFGRNAFQPESKVKAIGCGVNYACAISDSGNLYTWGRNKNCCLGLGDDKDQFFPLKVALGGSVRQVACGFDHMVAICKPFI